MQKVYQGGLTASILPQTKKFITNKETSGVVGVDIKSSYPNQMCTKKFPFSLKKIQFHYLGHKQINIIS